MARRAAPEVNAGSMADIAFLLLIFFLVTTTIETDSGISRMLPPKPDVNAPPPPKLKQRNIFTVIVNKDNQLLVEDELMKIEDLREAAVAFLDNGAGEGAAACTYCQGAGDEKSSVNPNAAVISLNNDRETTYGVYITVQNELVAAYNELRNREAQRLFGRSFTEDIIPFYNDKTNITDEDARDAYKEKYIKPIKDLFPMKLSEAETKKN